ncbi:uncharacterized protein JCM10292_006186 [Rhodotorula paludigena]|uniref:uncharacterized protein n=1 Tax=Rhodotorula paludigena TaxID=86838 RepID=UPI00316C71F8
MPRPSRKSASIVSYADAASDASDDDARTSTSTANMSKNTKNGAKPRKSSGHYVGDVTDGRMLQDSGDTRPVSSSSDETSDGDDYEATIKRKKRQTGSKGKGKGPRRKGKNHISKLPLDILSEICTHLSALDLVDLRLINKPFYRLLNDRDSGLWKRALRKARLPELTAGMLAPWQYAILELDQHCIKFGNTQFIPDRFLLRRFCRKCRKANLVRLDRLKGLPRPAPDDKALRGRQLLADRLTWTTTTRSAYIPDLHLLSSRLSSLQALDDADPSLNPSLAAAALAASSARARRAKEIKPRGMDPEKLVEGSRVEEFVKRREEALRLVVEDAEKLMKLRPN